MNNRKNCIECITSTHLPNKETRKVLDEIKVGLEHTQIYSKDLSKN